MAHTKEGLWTKDFTIITLGSAVSMMGNAMVGFAISLLVLDYTATSFLYALFMFLYTLPQIVMPVVAGPFMDRFSRRRTIYLLDFMSALLYCSAGVLIGLKAHNFAFLALLALASGSINSFYSVAFSSFYPMLISPGNYSKAYSVSSTLETCSKIMIPVSTFVYKLVGIAPLLVGTSAFFLLAAIMETRISDVEATLGGAKPQVYGIKQYISDSREGVRYLWAEKGLLFITVYFIFSSLASGASSVITLPWFRSNFADGEYIYISVWGLMVVGRVLGCGLHYRWKLPPKRKFTIAFIVYFSVSIIEGFYLFTPLNVMRVLCFLLGVLSATSYNIRVSSVQSYVPNEKKGRFHGAFLMLTTLGTLAGELTAGALNTFLPMRVTLSIFLGVCAVASVVFVGGKKRHIAPIYNQNI